MSAQPNITLADVFKLSGLKYDTFRQRVKKRLGENYNADRPATEKEIEILLDTRNEKPKTQPKRKPVKSETKPEKPERKQPKIEPKSSEAKTVFFLSISITVISISLTITGLFVFANWAGAMLGSMFSLFLFTSVWIARNKNKGDTGTQALSTVWKLETGAAFLHCFTFYRLLPEFPAGNWFFAARIILCGTLAGFAAYLSYNAVLTVRDYNAET